MTKDYIITRDSANMGKWIICREFGDMIEGDEIARRRGHWPTRKAAAEAAKQMQQRAESAGMGW